MRTHRTAIKKVTLAVVVVAAAAFAAAPGMAQAQPQPQQAVTTPRQAASATVGVTLAPPPPAALGAQVQPPQGAPITALPPLGPEAVDLIQRYEERQRRLQAIQDEISILELETRRDDLDRKRKGGTDVGRPQLEQRANVDDPKVLRVRGVGKDLIATFLLSNGGISDGSVNDVVGGWKILSISLQGVMAVAGDGESGVRKRLAFLGGGTGPGVAGVAPQVPAPSAAPMAIPTAMSPEQGASSVPPLPIPGGTAPSPNFAPGGSPFSPPPGFRGVLPVPGASLLPGQLPAR